MKKKIIQVLIILIGVALLVYPWIANYLNEHAAKSTISTYENEVKHTDKKEKEEMLEKARREEAETKAARDIKQQKYTKTEEKVKRSCEVFEKIRTQEGKAAHYKSVCRQAEQAGADLQKELDELE